MTSAESELTPSYRAPARTLPVWGDGPLESTLRHGRGIDDFEIIGLLGEGSLAKVYLARQLSLGRLVALKVSASRSAEELLASLIPLSGAVLLIGLGPEDMSRTFRTLVGALIVIGMTGVGLTHSGTRLLTRCLTVLAGTDRRPPFGPH